MTGKTENRYDMRPSENRLGFWTVYDIFTGEPAVVNDTVMDALDMDDADDLVDLLNSEYIARRSGPTH